MKSSSLLSGLKALGERSGAAVGDTYARIASSVLVGIERLEDSSAERRRKTRRSATPASKVERSNKSLPPVK